MSKKKESSNVPTKQPTPTTPIPKSKKTTPRKSLTLSATKTDSTKKRSLEKSEGPQEARKKIILAPFPCLDLVRHTPKTGKCCRIFAQIFCCIVSVIILICALPIFESVLFPEHFYSRFDSLLWDPLQKTEIVAQRSSPSLFINVNLRYDNIVFNLKLYSRGQLNKMNEIDKLFLCVDDGKIDETAFDHFVLCSLFPDRKPSYQKYVQVMKLCYLYIRQIAWNARIIGYGHQLGGNILVRASNELWKEYCYSFNNIVMVETRSDVMKGVQDALFYFQFAEIIEKNMMKSMKITENEFLQDAVKSTKVIVIHVTDNDEDKKMFGTAFGSSYHSVKTLSDALTSITDINEKDKYKPRKSVFLRYEEEKKCLLAKKSFSFF